MLDKLIKNSTFVAVLLSLAACASEQLFLDAVWESPIYEPRSFRKVAVFGIAKNQENQIAFEQDVVKYLNTKGVKAVAGHQLYDYDEKAGLKNATRIKRYLFSLGFDGVLTASAIENISKDDDDITNEELAAHTEGVYKFGQYYQQRYASMQRTPNPDANFAVLEANFFWLMDYSDFDGSGLVWISHFKADTEQPIRLEIDKYAKTIVDALFEDQVIIN